MDGGIAATTEKPIRVYPVSVRIYISRWTDETVSTLEFVPSSRFV
jgi:hypothetical protein